MPDKNPVIDKALADAKATLKATDHWPKLPVSDKFPDRKPVPKKPKSNYSLAREARDTGKSINFNLKQKQVANEVLPK